MSSALPYYEVTSYTEWDDRWNKTKISPVMVPHTANGRTQLHEGILIHNNGLGIERLTKQFEVFQQELKDTGNTGIHAQIHTFDNGRAVGIIYGDMQQLFNLMEANFPGYKPAHYGAVAEDMILKKPPISDTMLSTHILRSSYNRLMNEEDNLKTIAEIKTEFRDSQKTPPQTSRDL